MFRRIKEKQRLLEARTRALKLAERKISDRDILIGNMEEQAEVLHNENKALRFEFEEAEELIKRIERLVSSNMYNNEKAILNKIKELVSDYHSQN